MKRNIKMVIIKIFNARDKSLLLSELPNGTFIVNDDNDFIMKRDDFIDFEYLLKKFAYKEVLSTTILKYS